MPYSGWQEQIELLLPAIVKAMCHKGMTPEIQWKGFISNNLNDLFEPDFAFTWAISASEVAWPNCRRVLSWIARMPLNTVVASQHQICRIVLKWQLPKKQLQTYTVQFFQTFANQHCSVMLPPWAYLPKDHALMVNSEKLIYQRI